MESNYLRDIAAVFVVFSRPRNPRKGVIEQSAASSAGAMDEVPRNFSELEVCTYVMPALLGYHPRRWELDMDKCSASTAVPSSDRARSRSTLVVRERRQKLLAPH